MWQTLLLLAGIAAAGHVVTMTVLGLLSRRRPQLGVRDGQLTACPTLLNCVSTQASNAAHQIEPFPYAGSADEAMRQLRQLLAQLPRARVVAATSDYLHAEFTSLLFRFVDDVEFLIDDAHKVIHFRSASRIGRSDLGANRRRMEHFRRLWTRNP